MNCIIVDDEPLARDILESFITKVPFLKLIAVCKSGLEALDAISRQPVDLIFLDIQMSDITGIQLYKSLKTRPLVIFTTAYSQFAVQGFDVSATDYLVKPFSFERFLQAVNKANEQKTVGDSDIKNAKKNRDYIFIKDGSKTVRIWIKDINFMEGQKDYIKIHYNNRFLLTLMSMQTMLNLLPQDDFVRIHRSFIVPLSKIDSIERNRVIIGDNWIPIGSLYKDAFFRRISTSEN